MPASWRKQTHAVSFLHPYWGPDSTLGGGHTSGDRKPVFSQSLYSSCGRQATQTKKHTQIIVRYVLRSLPGKKDDDQEKGDGSLRGTVGRVGKTEKAKPEGVSHVTSAYKAFLAEAMTQEVWMDHGEQD